jgi:tetratricopeptide (TPR) repeat protein
MNLPENLKKWFLPLLVLAFIVIVMQDSMRMESPSPRKKTPEFPSATEEMEHDHSEGEDPHLDPEKNRRMGIFHYNEGNKALKDGKFQEAIDNYKMALHHDKNSQETYVNLSTTYMRSGQFGEALESLKKLEAINPSSPLLLYNLACYHSLTGNLASSLDSLKKSVDLGYRNTETFQTDPDLENLRGDAGFIEWAKTLGLK